MDHRIEDSLQYVHAEACVTIDAPVESIWNMILLFLPTIRETLEQKCQRSVHNRLLTKEPMTHFRCGCFVLRETQLYGDSDEPWLHPGKIIGEQLLDIEINEANSIWEHDKACYMTYKPCQHVYWCPATMIKVVHRIFKDPENPERAVYTRSEGVLLSPGFRPKDDRDPADLLHESLILKVKDFAQSYLALPEKFKSKRDVEIPAGVLYKGRRIEAKYDINPALYDPFGFGIGMTDEELLSTYNGICIKPDCLSCPRGHSM